MNQILCDRPSETLSETTGADLLARFGTREQRVARALARIAAGGGVIVVDDEDRENEGDIIYPADAMTTAQMAHMIRTCSGIVCLVLTAEDVDRLQLPPMVDDNSARFGTAFTVTIEAKKGVTTGVSAADRIQTIRTAIDLECRPEDLARPGHVFPLRAHPQGLVARRGHTEATIDLMRRAGRRQAGVLCEIMNDDGTMARLPQLVVFAEDNDFPVVTIEDLLATDIVL